jgi:high-affinity Fe2+/Pb2+ permease
MEQPKPKKLTDRWRDDPFPLYGAAVGLVIAALIGMVLLHGVAVAWVGTSLMLCALVFLAAAAWFGVSGYRQRTGRSRRR